MAGESEVTAVLNVSEHATKAITELLKFLGKTNFEIFKTTFNAISEGMTGISNDEKTIGTEKELKNGIVKQKNLIRNARKNSETVLTQMGINKNDINLIEKKAKAYGISIALVGEKGKDNMTAFFKERDSKIFETILKEIVAEKMKERPNDLRSFKIEPWAVEAMRAELIKHDLSTSFLKDKDGNIHCVYEASDKKAYDIAKNEFSKLHDEVKTHISIENQDGFTIIKDNLSGKEISFDEIIPKSQLKKIMEEEFKFNDVKSELAANKFADTLNTEQQRTFLKDNPMYDVNHLEYDIKLENESILLNDLSFMRINLKENGIDQIVVMDNKNGIAVSFSPEMKQSEIEELIRTRLGIDDEQTIAAISSKTEKLYEIYSEEMQKNLSENLYDKKNIIGTCSIERLNKNEFEIKIGDNVKTYNFNDKASTCIDIRRQLTENGMTLEEGTKLAKKIYAKAMAQSSYQVVKNVEQEPDMTKTEPKEIIGYRFERETGGTFTVKFEDKEKQYIIKNKKETLQKMQEDFGMSPEKAERIYGKVLKQSGYENEKRKENKKENPKTETNKTKTHSETKKADNPNQKRR